MRKTVSILAGVTALIVAIVAVVLLLSGSGHKPAAKQLALVQQSLRPEILLDGVAPTAPTPGQTLNASSGTWTNNPTTYNYQWLDCVPNSNPNSQHGTGCVPISGATSSTYTITTNDINYEIEVAVSACNALGCGSASAASTSLPTGLVEAAGTVPVNATPPSISGTPQSGQTLSATTGSWSGAPTSYTYQWQDCNSAGASCTNISGATGTTYVVGSGDVGSTIVVSVVATNGTGASTASSSSPTAVVSGTGTTGGTMGYTTVGATCSGIGSDIKAAQGPYTLSSTSVLNSFTMYLQPSGTAGSQTVEGLVYTDSSGSPGHLVATSNPITLSSTDSAGWQTASFPNPPTLAAGSYWVGFIGAATGNVLNHCQDTATPSSQYNNNTYSSGASDPFSASGTIHTTGFEISAYVSFSSGGGIPTPTPTAPTGLVTTAGNTSVSLSWTAATESGGSIASYQIFRNGSQIGTSTSTSYNDTGLTNGTSYSYYVKAVDGSGTVSGASSTVSATPSPPSGGGGTQTVAAAPDGPPTPSGGWTVEYADAFGDCSSNPDVGCGINAPKSDNTYWPNRCVGAGSGASPSGCTHCNTTGCMGDNSGTSANTESIRSSETSIQSDGAHLNLVYAGGNNTPCNATTCPYLGSTINGGDQTCSQGGGQGSNGQPPSSVAPGYNFFQYKLGTTGTIAIQGVVQWPVNTEESDPAMWGFSDGCWNTELDTFEGHGYYQAGTGANGWCNAQAAINSFWNGTNSGTGHVTGPHYDTGGFFCNSNLTGSYWDPAVGLHTFTAYVSNGSYKGYVDGHQTISGTISGTTNWGTWVFQNEARTLKGFSTVGTTRTLIVRSVAVYEATSDHGALVENPHIAPGTTVG